MNNGVQSPVISYYLLSFEDSDQCLCSEDCQRPVVWIVKPYFDGEKTCANGT